MGSLMLGHSSSVLDLVPCHGKRAPARRIVGIELYTMVRDPVDFVRPSSSNGSSVRASISNIRLISTCQLPQPVFSCDTEKDPQIVLQYRHTKMSLLPAG